MQQPQNPFTTLYVTERMEEDKFPTLFSPTLVPQVLPLFQAGNVVVRGTQGTGKSMLLALLRTDIRLAFEASRDDRYPVDAGLCQFVSAEINLATNQALRFAHRWGGAAATNVLSDLQGSFVDYVNTWLLRDLLTSLHTLQGSQTGIWDRYDLGGANCDLDAGVRAIAKNRVAGALLNRPRHWIEARDQLTKRLETYLQFLNGKLRTLPNDIKDRQAQAIGQPITAAVQVLRSQGCLADSTRVLVTIDQFEQLLDFEVQLKGRHFTLLRSIIDEALHLREPTICYRIGTRPHAWRNRRSERLRDYIELDLDDLLSRKEHSRTALFPVLASDVFKRRLQSFGYRDLALTPDPLKAAFGNSPSPAARIKRMTSKTNWLRLLKVPRSLPEPLLRAIEGLAKESPLSAKLGSAWAQQQLSRDDAVKADVLAAFEEHQWDQPAKQWWKKERVPLAVLQLAAACGQRVPMFGKRDILNLSGSNILVFGSICQHIWACWLRSSGTGANDGSPVLPIEDVLQDEGVRNASREWHRKIAEEAWLGDSLTQFIDVAGNYLHASLIADQAMSYPGGNGISLSDKDLKAFPEVEQILLDGTDRGFLLQRRHTPKNRSRGPSTKWYLHPVLAPHFELTVGHTKEPLYVRAKLVRSWMEQAGIVLSKEREEPDRPGRQQQKKLPGFEDAE